MLVTLEVLHHIPAHKIWGKPFWTSVERACLNKGGATMRGNAGRSLSLSSSSLLLFLYCDHTPVVPESSSAVSRGGVAVGSASPPEFALDEDAPP